MNAGNKTCIHYKWCKPGVIDIDKNPKLVPDFVCRWLAGNRKT